jgi:hypothetical protein
MKPLGDTTLRGERFPIDSISHALALRLSAPGWPPAEIAPLFEEIAAEAERLMKISSLLTKFGREESSGL